MLHRTEHNIVFSALLLFFSVSPVHRSTVFDSNSVWSLNKQQNIRQQWYNISSMMLIAVWMFFFSVSLDFMIAAHFSSNKGIICFIFDLLSAKSFSQLVTKVNVPLYKHIEKSAIGLQFSHITYMVDEAVRKLRSA